MGIWKTAVMAEDLPRLGDYPTSPEAEEDKRQNAAALKELWAAERDLLAAEIRLEKAKAAMPEYWIEMVVSAECSGNHQHGPWCASARVKYSSPPLGRRVYPDRLVAERGAYLHNCQAEKAWQDFLAC